MNAEQLYKSINEQLKTNGVWTQEQSNIYTALKLLVQDHKENKIFFKNNIKYADYVKFIKEQDWFMQEKDRIYIQSIVSNLVLVERPIIQNAGIKMQLIFKNNHSTLNAFYDKGLNIFYLYFSKDNVNAYVAYYNPHNDTKMQLTMRIPEFEKIYEITGILDTMFKKSSLLCFVIDAIRFHGGITLLQLPIGLSYDITLEQLYTKIRV